MGIGLLSQRRVSLLAGCAAAILGTIAGVWATDTGQARAASRTPVATSAKSITIDEMADMSLVGHPGHVLNERGTVSGTYRGTIEARLVTVTNTYGEATVTAYMDGGALKAKADTHGRVEKNEGATGHFYGTSTITGGTGMWAHASGTLAFSGTINRQNLHATVQMHGTLQL
jgi:hypothetical protein